MPTETDTCRRRVVPKLQAPGWDNDPHSIAAKRGFTTPQLLTTVLDELRAFSLSASDGEMVKTNLQRATRLRQSSLQRAFSGKL
jgi:hypothetical protein